MPNPAPEASAPGAAPGLAPISERRGAVVAGALVCTTLLVVGYGSGIGVVPLGPMTASGAPGAAGDGDGGGSTATTQLPDVGLDVPDAGFVTTNAPGGGGGIGITAPGGGGSVGIDGPGGVPGIVVPGLPPGVTLPPPDTVPPPSTTPPTTTPPGTTPPTTPPAECSSLVGGLLGGLTGYLAGPAPDPLLVQHVSDALGLESYLPGSTGGLLDLGGTLGVTDVLGELTTAVTATLATTVGTMTGSAVELTPNLIPGLRQLLGVDLVSTATVTADQLLGLLGTVLGSC